MSHFLKLIPIVFAFFCSSKMMAQVTDSATANTVVIYQDARLNALDDRPAAVIKYIEEAKNAEKRTIEKPKEPAPPVLEEIKVGNKVVTGSIKNIDGFRVLIYNGNSRDVAMNVKGAFDKAYAGTRSYLTYNAPRYKIKVGNFETKSEAEKLLKQIIKLAPSASIVPDVVTIKNILVQ